MRFRGRAETDTLAWLAFRYVHDDLDAEEAARFEARLAGDIAACEAVVEAARLRECLTHAEFRPVLFSRKRQGAVLRLAALAATVLLAVVLSFTFREPAGPPGSDAREIALAWADLRDLAGPWSVAVDGALTDLSATDEFRFEPSPEGEDDSEPLSSWMVELASLSDSPGHDEPDSGGSFQ